MTAQNTEKAPAKIRSICIDTLTGIQNEMYMASLKKPTHDKWFDWGRGIWALNTELQDLGFETILVLGDPGTGKSTGMATLESGTSSRPRRRRSPRGRGSGSTP